MKYALQYQGNLRTEIIHLKSNTKIITDAPVDNKGKGESFSPTDLTAVSLASCMITIMGIKAQENNINIIGTTAEADKIMLSNPRRIGEIIVKIKLPENLSEKERKILMKSALTCPVALSLHPDIKQTVLFV
ncbi:MAG TPA: osmotically inducible protein OsmC [Flavobacteriales bacterium]|nr:osmotically inducible protein OsmC [Flavobacteriales bacterium]|tara:strand:+ start:28382 stop:28777 length:396 start_codon:yes stop_codon:yes gene_type:complete